MEGAEQDISSMADVSGPDIVGLLANEVSYGAYGDHGGRK